MTEKQINDEGNKEKAKKISNILNELSTGEKSKDIMKKYFDTENIEIGIKKVESENGKKGNASLNRDDNCNDTIYFYEIKASDFYSGMSKINYGINSSKEININESETLSVNFYAHEQEHHLQKHLETIDKNTPKLAVRLLDIAAEIKGREKAICFLEDVHKGKNNVLDFRKIINGRGGYNISINRLTNFFKDYEMNENKRKEVINKFIERTHKDDFYPKNAVDIFLEIINDGRKYKLNEQHIKRYIPD